DGRGKIEIDLAELSDRMGREITVQDFLVVFSTFYGRINMDEKCFGVYADMLGLEDPK
ncbi:MAG: MmoB/DmpM family protein, partial [Candidatus Binatia bacterium]